MKSIAIIQARMGASRLPGKVLLPLGGSCVLDYIVSRCKAIPGLTDVIVATTTLERDDNIAAWCKERGVSVFRGDEIDVLSRFLEAALPYEADYILRVTADNPFFDYELASDLIAAAAAGSYELIAFGEGSPHGSAVELISYKALQRIGHLANEPRHREHVTIYAYEYPERFRMTRIELPEARRQPRLRITLDTEADYTLLQAIASAFPDSQTVSTEKVVRYLLQHPEIASTNMSD